MKQSEIVTAICYKLCENMRDKFDYEVNKVLTFLACYGCDEDAKNDNFVNLLNTDMEFRKAFLEEHWNIGYYIKDFTLDSIEYFYTQKQEIFY